jgi:glutathione S-transferase
MTITLCGLAISNYYNKVKLALLEKGVPFEEERVATGSRDEAVLAASPLGKIPFLRTESGTLCESQAILDYIEERWPEPPLLPAEPYARAKVRELTTFVDLHLELVARELYPQVFFGGAALSESSAARVRKLLERHIGGLKRLARFAPYVAGEAFTQADCSAWNSLPLVGVASKTAFGEDLLLAAGVDWKSYVKSVGERSSAQKVAADRKAAAAAQPA